MFAGGVRSVRRHFFPFRLSEQSYLHTLDLALLHKNNGPGIKQPAPPTPHAPPLSSFLISIAA